MRSATGAGGAGALDKETPVSEGLDAAPRTCSGSRAPTYLPFVAAVGVAVLFVGLLVEAVVIGVLGGLIGASASSAGCWRTSEELR